MDAAQRLHFRRGRDAEGVVRQQGQDARQREYARPSRRDLRFLTATLVQPAEKNTPPALILKTLRGVEVASVVGGNRGIRGKAVIGVDSDAGDSGSRVDTDGRIEQNMAVAEREEVRTFPHGSVAQIA